jgi:hypothetical protein
MAKAAMAAMLMQHDKVAEVCVEGARLRQTNK